MSYYCQYCNYKTHSKSCYNHHIGAQYHLKNLKRAGVVQYKPKPFTLIPIEKIDGSLKRITGNMKIEIVDIEKKRPKVSHFRKPKERITCDCGQTFLSSYLDRHLQSRKHLSYLFIREMLSLKP